MVNRAGVYELRASPLHVYPSPQPLPESTRDRWLQQRTWTLPAEFLERLLGAQSGPADQKLGLKTGQLPRDTNGPQPPDPATGRSGPWATLLARRVPAAAAAEEKYPTLLLRITCLGQRLGEHLSGGVNVACACLSSQEQGKQTWSLCVCGFQPGVALELP